MKYLISVLLFLQVVSSFGQAKPKLVVGIVVDQMKEDYLLRYYSNFTEGGFKRLMNEGAHFRNAHYNYIPTVTAAGHASIYTGTTPSVHGIIGNSWYAGASGQHEYCALDTLVHGVGGNQDYGHRSPRNLLSTTITDELLLSTNFQSKVVAVSIKDRGAIFPAGHNPTGAYWLDGHRGQFMTSSYYSSTLPNWVSDFNGEKRVEKYLNQVWHTLYPLETYSQSSQDNSPYERKWKGKDAPVFPYDLKKLSKENGLKIISSTPFGNSLLLDFALAAVEGEKLGTDQTTDFLSISFCSTDYAGHDFGTHAVEIQDMYLRLDADVKRLLDYLDKNFKDEYLLFLTSDHGVVPVPQFLMDMKMPAGYVQNLNNEALSNELTRRLGAGEWIEGNGYGQIYLNHNLIREKGWSLSDVQEQVREILLQFPEVSEVFTARELAQRSGSSKTRLLIENGYHTKRSGDLAYALKPGFLYDKPPAGTGHGSGYTYDTHVPILFFGKNIPKVASVRPVAITDIASTLSMLLNISLPSGNTGEPLIELFD